MPNACSMVHPPENTHPYDLMRLGQMDYAQALAIQQQRVETLIAHGGPNLLMLLEHPPVYTIGRSGKSGEILDAIPTREHINIIATDRGGRVTYHGPGQLVAYVIRDLRPDTGRILDHVRRLEETIIGTLACFGILGTRERANPGVWVGNEKIAALGVR
ncbi:MAG TPA: lipoyl(octanoyl) transferase LipB, partial [Magnetococcales bacterium]|nr:lipoyl(octanoyl) transferase LipB [Magnetococcales bacterium]